MLQRIRIRNRILNFFPVIGDLKESFSLGKSYRIWRRDGLPIPAPQPIKRSMLTGEAKRIEAKTFVETGTFTADTVWYMRHTFQTIFSIEVEPTLAAIATERFREQDHIKIVLGDSAEVLDAILREVSGPTLFWLDGHYSAGVTGKGTKDCPIYEELAAIAARPPERFSIVIDDLRCFGTEDGYPTWDELTACIGTLFPKLKIDTALDMIWCRG